MNPQSSSAAGFSRRRFLKGALLAGAALGFPSILSFRARGAEGGRISVGIIGCGRMAQSHADLLAFEPDVQFAALCDVDSIRVEKMRAKLTGRVPQRTTGIKVFKDYRELLADPAVEAVLIATPDHWHALLAIEAMLAGKDVYVEKPCTLTIAEGIALSTVAQKQKRIVQVGSQQRSLRQFVRASEIVRNGGIGRVRRVQIGLPVDQPGGSRSKMKVPAGLDYERWLGPAPELFYTEDRVHPQSGFGRPGWMRGESFCNGMIANWGTHHVDIAHWALGLEHSGPVKASGHAEFLKNGLWNVHGAFESSLEYAEGLVIEINSRFNQGIRFEGDQGWLFVSRTAIRPPGNPNGKPILQSLDAGDPRILKAAPGKIQLGHPVSHHRDWLDSIRSRNQPVAPVDQGHRSCSACQLAYTAMKLDRSVRWDPKRQKFENDPAASRLMAIQERGSYSIPKVLSAAQIGPLDLEL